MPAISAQMVKQLREKTGVGIMDCKAALADCDGDLTKAVELLRKKGMATAQKRSGRDTSEGVVQSYIHMGGKIGVLVEVNCESDFVAKNEGFVKFAKDIAMHIAAANPIALIPEDVSAEIVAKEKEIYMGQAKELGKPENMLEKIAEGKLKKFFKENCLLNQAYVKDPSISISDYLTDTIGKIGENIKISKFARFQLGE